MRRERESREGKKGGEQELGNTEVNETHPKKRSVKKKMFDWNKCESEYEKLQKQ